MDIYQADQIACEIYSILVKHNLTVSDAERVLDHTKTSFKHARLSSNEKPIFDKGINSKGLTPHEVETMKELAQMKTNQTFVTLTPSVNVRTESKVTKAMLIALEEHLKTLS